MIRAAAELVALAMFLAMLFTWAAILAPMI